MSLTENAYWAIDNIITTLWPRIKTYRNLGVPLRTERQVAVAAEIYVQAYERNGLRLSDNDKSFLREESAAASYLDDYKDFILDRQAGHGYRDDNTRAELRNRWLLGMYNAQSCLTFKQKIRHYAFLALGGLYQVREIIGIKART